MGFWYECRLRVRSINMCWNVTSFFRRLICSLHYAYEESPADYGGSTYNFLRPHVLDAEFAPLSGQHLPCKNQSTAPTTTATRWPRAKMQPCSNSRNKQQVGTRRSEKNSNEMICFGESQPVEVVLREHASCDLQSARIQLEPWMRVWEDPVDPAADHLYE